MAIGSLFPHPCLCTVIGLHQWYVMFGQPCSISVKKTVHFSIKFKSKGWDSFMVPHFGVNTYHFSLIPANPDCEEFGCGEWTPPLIPNPAYKGKWTAPLIDNPNYMVRYESFL